MLRSPRRKLELFNEAQHVDQLVEIYRQGFEEILRIIIRKEAKGQWTKYWRDLLLDIRDILYQLDTFADEWIETVISQVYSQAVAETVAYLHGLGMRAPEKPEFAQIHQRAIDVVAQNMATNLRGATQYIGRRVNDVFRRVGLEATAGKLAAGATVRDMKREVVRRLMDQGQTAFVDRLGRKWRLDRYAEMVARTTTREAATVATLNECKEFGLDLVRISTHSPTCEICAPIQGKVFSISGKDKRYPKLLPEYMPPIHPNCRHVLVPYVRELDTNAEETQELSNTWPKGDPRPQTEKQAYRVLVDKPAKGLSASETEITRLLANAPLDDREKLARHLLDESGLKNVPVRLVGTDDWGGVKFRVVNGQLETTEVLLRLKDPRPARYRLKTVFHEVVHARMNGGHTAAKTELELAGMPGWTTAEEVIAETCAHYLVLRAGYADELYPSYSRFLVETLPKLKTLPAFASCKTIADFGKILIQRRFASHDAEHVDLNGLVTQTPISVQRYAESYLGYISEHMDEIIDVIHEGLGGLAGKEDIRKSITRGLQGYIDEPGFHDALAISMNRLGVNKP